MVDIKFKVYSVRTQVICWRAEIDSISATIVLGFFVGRKHCRPKM